MEKKNLDWANIGFEYVQTDKRYVANYKDGKWDEGTLTEDANIVMNECAGVTYRYLSPGSECGAHGGFGKTFGNAGLSGRPIC